MSGLSSTLGGRWWAKALGLLLIPVLIAAGLLAATWNSCLLYTSDAADE